MAEGTMNSNPSWITIGSLAALLIAGGIARGQEPVQQPDDARAAHLARMKAVAATFQVFAAQGQPESKLELPAEPLLRYADSTRQTNESSLWILGGKGRPSAVLVIEYYPDIEGRPRWLYEVASLSTERIAAERGDDLKWAAKRPGLDLQPVPDAGPPAARPAQRLVQMRTLRARFAAHERANIEGRIELRPLASPLHRYADAERGIVDGAIFSFASGTNPQVLLVLEARETDGKQSWGYALVQLTGERVTAQLDGKDIWQRDAAVPPAVRDSYVNGWLAVDAPKE
jgi:hypothetical protein